MISEEELDNIRYFKVNKDTYLDGQKLKKGDIIRIRNEDISDKYILNSTFRYHYLSPFERIDTIIGEYPKDEPITYKSVIEFLKGKKIQLDSYSKLFSLSVGYNHGVYLNYELAERIFGDLLNDVELDIFASTKGAQALFPNYPEETATKKYNEALDLGDGHSFPMPLGDYNKMCIHEAGGFTSFSGFVIDDISKEELREAESMVSNSVPIKPGIYNTKGKVSVKYYMLPDEVIDFDKIEYLYNFINHGFLEFLDSTTEIRDRTEKEEIFNSVVKDTIDIKDTSEQTDRIINRIRYYRVKPGVSISASDFNVYDTDRFLDGYFEINGCDSFDISRVSGEIRLVEKDSNDEAKVIKVIINEGTEANHAYVTDMELSKIADRLSGLDLHMTRLKEIRRRNRMAIQRLREKYGENNQKSSNGKNNVGAITSFERKMMLIDIAAMRVQKTSLTEEFKQKAEEFYVQNSTIFEDVKQKAGDNNKQETNERKAKSKKTPYLKSFEETYSAVIDDVNLDEGDSSYYWESREEMAFFKYVFYMVHTIERSLPNPKLAEEHSRLKADARKSFTSQLGGILRKRIESEAEDRNL